jgi:hypothetical protein
MGRITKFLRLPGKDRALLLQAFCLIIGIRLALKTMRFVTLRAALARLAAAGHTSRRQMPANEEEQQRTVWAVRTAARAFPAISTCLTNALAAHVLLARRGYVSNLRIGVTRDDKGDFTAHAWLEQEGEILIGGDWSAGFTPMPALNGLEP